MTNSIKKKLIRSFKSLGYYALSLFHGKIEGIIDIEDNASIKTFTKKFDKELNYIIFEIDNCRVYTDTVTDTAFIIENKLIKGPSFQHRNPKNADITENIVLQKGTPKLKKKLKGSVFSLLTGGGGNSNYWHWLFDVLPRIKILDGIKKLDEIDFFLLPDNKKKFQKESLNLLNIPEKKIISSINYRHIIADKVIAVDHPYAIKNDPSNEIQNIPFWIIEYLRYSFKNKINNKNFPKKIYIDRRDATSNHRHLRKILNENEVKNYLSKKGYSIIALSELSFEDQIHLFSNASSIIGLHGAGFANLVFCEPGTKVLELKPKNAGFMYANLAKKVSLHYNDISIRSVDDSNNQQGLIIVPINLLEKKIS